MRAPDCVISDQWILRVSGTTEFLCGFFWASFGVMPFTELFGRHFSTLSEIFGLFHCATHESS